MNRRRFLAAGAGGTLVASAGVSAAPAQGEVAGQSGSQRLTLEQLQRWESLEYGMFIHFGMSTFDGDELSKGNSPASLYAPDQLNVDQWIQVARDAGMRYAVLTTKHVAGHCLWPSAFSDYTVARSGNKTDVVEAFVRACEKHGILPGFYYCSWDNHNRFGSRTPSDPKGDLPAFTSSIYQTFQTNQITELLTHYGPIAEVWIDTPGILGRGYRSFLYDHVASLQPSTIIMMNSGIATGESYDIEYAWPSDLIAIERRLPPDSGHKKWRSIEGKDYYMPGEVCDPIGKDWFWVEADQPRSDEELLSIFTACRQRRVNLLLDVPPDQHGLIPKQTVEALMRLRKNANL